MINAATGEAALRLASQSRFDAVVCDADLAVAGGVPIVDELRASSGCAHARFVLSAAAFAFGAWTTASRYVAASLRRR